MSKMHHDFRDAGLQPFYLFFQFSHEAS